MDSQHVSIINGEKLEKQELDERVPVDEKESHNRSVADIHTNIYSSDDSNQSKDSRKVSRRHYLPSEELEKLRKRERDAKRKQRERYRQASNDQVSI